MSLYSRLHPTTAAPTASEATYCGAQCARVHVGRIDRLGYLYCLPCADRLSIAGDPVHLDAAPHNTEDCDSCGRGIARSDLAAPTLSPFTRRALARELPTKDLTR